MNWGLDEVRVTRGGSLDGVTVPAPAGAVTVVVGGDGAGKTTSLRVLAGLLTPDSGTVRRPPKERIGYVPATAGLYADLTVAGPASLARARGSADSCPAGCSASSRWGWRCCTRPNC
jgi:ABC-type multidrug transport system ATPase subunit